MERWRGASRPPAASRTPWVCHVVRWLCRRRRSWPGWSLRWGQISATGSESRTGRGLPQTALAMGTSPPRLVCAAPCHPPPSPARLCPAGGAIFLRSAHVFKCTQSDRSNLPARCDGSCRVQLNSELSAVVGRLHCHGRACPRALVALPCGCTIANDRHMCVAIVS